MISLKSVYFFLVASLPIVDGILRVRLGAGWEPSILATIFLFILCLSVSHQVVWVRQAIIFVLPIYFLLAVSNIFGIFFYTDGMSLNSEKIEQINSVEARMLVESIRYMACIFAFSFTYFFLNSVSRLNLAITVFLFAAIIEGLYGMYEFTVKISGYSGLLPLLRGGEENIESIFRVYGTFFEPSNFGQFMGCAFLIYIGYLQLVRNGRLPESMITKRWFLVVIILLLSILISFSRTAFLALAVSLLLKVLFDIASFNKARAAVALKWLFLSNIISICIIYGVSQLVSDDYLAKWYSFTFDFSLDSDYENTSRARVNSVIEMTYNALNIIKNYPMGIGQGMAYLETGFSPFAIRLPQEIGLLPFLIFVGIFFISATRAVKPRNIAYYFLPALICLAVISLNYNSTNHIWFWFCFALIFRISSFDKRFVT